MRVAKRHHLKNRKLILRNRKKPYVKLGRLILGNRRKPYVRLGRLTLGNGKTQREECLGSIAAPLAPMVTNGLAKIFRGGRKQRYAKRVVIKNITLIGNKMDKIAEKVPARDKIIVMKRKTTKRITLLNGRTFVARYELVTHDHLPASIQLEQTYKQKAASHGRYRCCQRPQLAKKVVKTSVMQEVRRMALRELSNLYHKDTDKIKNKNIRKILQIRTAKNRIKIIIIIIFHKNISYMFVICLKWKVFLTKLL